MTIDHTPLPGIGPRYTVPTEDGRHVGVVRHQNQRELVVYDIDDPERVAVNVMLTPAEAEALAELLGSRGPAVHVAKLERHQSRLASVQLLLGAGSHWAGRTVADMNRRADPHATVVAVARQDEVILSPQPRLVLRQGDMVVLLGPADLTYTAADQLTQR